MAEETMSKTHILMAEETMSKWEGKSSTKLGSTTAEQVWPLFEDFCNFNKWLPTIDTCYQVEGVYGKPGLIRYCASTIQSSSADQTIIRWCHEKLLSIDPVQRCLTYEVKENNLGLTSYVGTFKVIGIDGDDEGGCEIEWSFMTDPVDGWSLEDLHSYTESSLQAMAERMEKALRSTT